MAFRSNKASETSQKNCTVQCECREFKPDKNQEINYFPDFA